MRNGDYSNIKIDGLNNTSPMNMVSWKQKSANFIRIPIKEGEEMNQEEQEVYMERQHGQRSQLKNNAG